MVQGLRSLFGMGGGGGQAGFGVGCQCIILLFQSSQQQSRRLLFFSSQQIQESITLWVSRSTHLIIGIPSRLLLLRLIQLCPIHHVTLSIRGIIPVTARRPQGGTSHITRFQAIVILLLLFCRGDEVDRGGRRDIDGTPIGRGLFRVRLDVRQRHSHH